MQILQATHTLTQLQERAVEKMTFAAIGEIETASSMTIARHNLLQCRSMEYMADVWLNCHLTKSRFPKLQRDYLDLPSYEGFLDRCTNVARRKGSVASLSAKFHKAHGFNEFMPRGNLAHGSCMLGFTYYVGKNGKPHFGFHSRVSYLGYLSVLDLALCYVICRDDLSRLTNHSVEDFAFTWYVDALQIASMQCMAWYQDHPKLIKALDSPKKWPSEDYPTIRIMRKTLWDWRRKMEEGPEPEDEPYGQLRRYRRRWESRVSDDGKWSSIPLDQLTLNSLKSTKVEIPDEEGLEIELVEREVA